MMNGAKAIAKKYNEKQRRNRKIQKIHFRNSQ